MENTIIAEGKTTNEAIENGLKQLKVPKDCVEIKVLENEDKRSFFSILAPRVVKVEMKVKEQKASYNKEQKNNYNNMKKEIELNQEEQNKAEENLEHFLKEFILKLPEGTSYNIEKSTENLKVNIIGKELGYLIGYRGETLYALQSVLSSIASKEIKNRVRVILDIEGYKAKREKTLEDLADKVAKTVVRTKKPIKLEPMQAYERKIIHSKLQQNTKVETISVGEEPYRRIIISLKNN